MNNLKESKRKKLYNLLGKLPERSREISSELISEQKKGTYILQKLSLDLNGFEIVPAYFVKPKNVKDKYPTILYNHGHGLNYELGKEELLIGHKGLIQEPFYAEELTRNGYAALCIDNWAFGERKSRTESEIFKFMLWHGQVMWGMMVYDSLRAIDYLISRDDVDSSRIGTMGLSMGSTTAWWVSALDTRIKACISICCLTDFYSLIDTYGLDRHGIYYYVPGLLNHFETAEIVSLISPRPHLSLNGNYDPLTPTAGLIKIDKFLKEVYKNDNSEDSWVLRRYDTGHYETAIMRKEIISFLKKWL